MTSTIAEFFVRPALFWTIGRDAGMRIVEESVQVHDEKQLPSGNAGLN
jgi:HME family heavy-metal exporter